jgi:DNA-binding beta-propeller fold protein YncE
VDGCNGKFERPWGIAVDRWGNVFVNDRLNRRIQKFDSEGTFLGKWGESGVGAGQFVGATDVAVDAAGNVYVADMGNHRIQKFDGSGTFLMMWGWGVQDGSSALQTCTSGCQEGIPGPGNGQFNKPWALDVDAWGNILVADKDNHRVQKFASNATFLIKWGSQGSGFRQFLYPRALATTAGGSLFISDDYPRIHWYDTDGTFLVKWGSAGTGEGQFDLPASVAVDAAAGVYVADWDNHRVQKLDKLGNVLSVWGWGVQDGSSEFQTCTGGCQAGLAGAGHGQFNRAAGVAVDARGNVYVADSLNHRIQKLGPALEIFVAEPEQPRGH